MWCQMTGFGCSRAQVSKLYRRYEDKYTPNEKGYLTGGKKNNPFFDNIVGNLKVE